MAPASLQYSIPSQAERRLDPSLKTIHRIAGLMPAVHHVMVPCVGHEIERSAAAAYGETGSIGALNHADEEGGRREHSIRVRHGIGIVDLSFTLAQDG